VTPGVPPTVSVVVPAYRSDATLAACLRSIAALRPPPLERILGCDGHAPGLESLAAEAGFRLAGYPDRSGPARARNAGAEAATGDVLLFLDSDVSVPPDLVARLGEVFDAHPDAVAVFGSYDNSPLDPGLVSRYRNLLHHYVHQTSSETASSFWAGCGAIRRACFLQLGGFDESCSRPSVEDIELGYRIHGTGGAIRLAKHLQVTHLKRWTLASFLWTDLTRRALPWTRLILRGRRPANDLNLSRRHRASLATSAGIALSTALLPFGLWWGWLAAACAAAFMALNRGFFAFLWKRGGPRLALLAVPLHLLHYLAGGLGFAIGLAEWMTRKR
jgi:GT2 family glycosyltransferase